MGTLTLDPTQVACTSTEPCRAAHTDTHDASAYSAPCTSTRHPRSPGVRTLRARHPPCIRAHFLMSAGHHVRPLAPTDHRHPLHPKGPAAASPCSHRLAAGHGCPGDVDHRHRLVQRACIIALASASALASALASFACGSFSFSYSVSAASVRGRLISVFCVRQL